MPLTGAEGEPAASASALAPKPAPASARRHASDAPALQAPSARPAPVLPLSPALAIDGLATDSQLAARLARITEWLLLVIALGIVGAMIAWSLFKAHEALDATERDRLRGQARVVDENVGQQLDGMNKALASVRDEFLTTSASTSGVPASISVRLKALSDAIPGVRSMILVDADGNVAASSVNMLVGRGFADRDYFRAARDGSGDGTLYVASPFATSLGGYTVVFARAIRAPNGAFLGIVAAALEPDYFQVLLRSVLYAPDMWVSLAHGDGKVFVTMPQDAARVRGTDAAFTEFTRAAAGATTTSIVVGRIGDSTEPRLTALRAIAPTALHMDKPLVIAVSRGASELFAPWREQALSYSTFFVLLSAGAAFGLYRGQYRRQSYASLQASAARERRETAEQLQLALKGADLGLWDWDVRRDHFDRNDTVVQQLGYAPNELGNGGPAWRALLHGEDTARLLAAIEDHSRRDTAAYECEYRVRHKDGRWVWLLSRGKIVERDEFDNPVRMTGTHMDLTLRKQAEAEAERVAQMLRRTGQLANIGGWELELATMRLEWTEQVFRIHELHPATPLRLERAIDFFAPEARSTIQAAVEAGARDGTPWDLELPFITARGNPRWVRTQGVAVCDDGRPVRLLGAFQDITENKLNALELHRVNEELVRLSTTDALTQVGNRRLFDQTLKSEWKRAARRAASIALLMIDVDHFKEYNDHYGHPAGDEVLRQIARLVGDSVRRGGELVARYGGEEFVLLLPGTDLESARVVAERCRLSIADAKIEHRASSTSAWVGVSIGVASHVASSTVDSKTLVETADAALYRAKRCGRGRIEY